MNKRSNDNQEVITSLHLPEKKEFPLSLDLLNSRALLGALLKHGNIIVRGDELCAKRFRDITDSFTASYSLEPKRRYSDSGEASRVDDIGSENDKSINLHSEASFSPSWPRIITFYSSEKSDIPTDIADGTTIWNQLKPSTREFFCVNPVVYDLALDLSSWTKKLPRGVRDIPSSSPGVRDMKIDGDRKIMYAKVSRYAVHETPDGNIAFSNHIFHSPAEPQILSMLTVDNKPYPLARFKEEVSNVYKKIAVPFLWEKNSLMILDNRRMMHGRFMKTPIEAASRVKVLSSIRLKI
jgi:hypothetical protein